MSFNKLCPRFDDYQILYPQSTRLQASLCEFYASIVRCCKQSLQMNQRRCKFQLNYDIYHCCCLRTLTGPSQFLNALTHSFQTEFEPYEADIRRCSEDVEKEILLAKAQADYQDQQLQFKEREAASDGRKILRSFITKASKDNEEFREWMTQRDERDASKYRRDTLTS